MGSHNSTRKGGEAATVRPLHLQRVLPYEDEIRSVAVGYAEVGLARRREIAFAQKARGPAPKEPPVGLGLPPSPLRLTRW